MTDNRKPAPTLAAVHAFLLGESTLDGLTFGEPHPGRPPYWWRYQLREALGTTAGRAVLPPDVQQAIDAAAPPAAYSVQPTRCTCHPETCACKPWALKHGAATVTSFNDRDAAVETAARLNR